MSELAYIKIQKELPYLNPALKKIGHYILNHPERCKTISTKNLADACDVAESTITRFVKTIGFSSFQEMKISLAEYLTTTEVLQNEEENPKLYEDLNSSDTMEQVIQKLVYRNTETLTETMNMLNLTALQQAVDLVSNADTITLISQGYSNVAANEAMMMFSRIGKKCILFEDECNQLMAASVCKDTDLFIGISNSGRTKKVSETLRIAKSNQGKTIGITAFENSPVAQNSDIVLITPTQSKTAETGITWEMISSKTAQILIIDVLCSCYSLKHFDDVLKKMDATYHALKNTRTPRQEQ